MWCVLLLALAEPEAANGRADEVRIEAAGLPTDGPGLAEFLRQRARLEVDVPTLTALADDLGHANPVKDARARAGLVMRGKAALPVLQRVINELGAAPRTTAARRCAALIEGTGADTLPAAVVRLLAERRPADAIDALLTYLPAAESDLVLEEVGRALTVLAFVGGKPHAALLEALRDKVPLRRAVACAALARPERPEQHDKLRPLLRDPQPLVRLKAALALVAANDAAAVPVLIDLLSELPVASRQPVEDTLRQLAGPWAPADLKGEDEIARRIRRDAWLAWWKNVDGPALLAEFRRRTLTSEERTQVAGLIDKLSANDFDVRQKAASELVAQGTRGAPLLRAATRSADLERSRRAADCLRQIAEEARPLPAAAVRLVGLRKPEGALQVLLEHIPFTDDDALLDALRATLPALALRAGQPDPLLLQALADREPQRRCLAAETLLQIGGEPYRPAVRKLLADAEPTVRLKVALALAAARDKAAVPVLIDAQADEPSDLQAQALEILERLAGEKAPEVEPGSDAAARKKVRDAWAAWWKEAGATVTLTGGPAFLGYTLLVEAPEKGKGGRVREVGRDNQNRWSIEGLDAPCDAHILAGNRVLIAESGSNKVSERDFKGTILWQTEVPDTPVNCQRLANGHTFVALDAGFAELDRTGKIVWKFAMKGVDAGYRLPDGNIVCLTRDNRVVRLQPNGQEIKAFPCKRDDDVPGGIDVLPNGNYLVAQPSDKSVVEMDAQGNVLWQTPAPGITAATRLAGGTTLLASQDEARVTEVDRSGKVIWELKSTLGVCRARRR